MPKVIYLTGAPAAGKSSTLHMMAERVSGLLIWEYGARLTEYVSSKAVKPVLQSDLRMKSSIIVTPEDINKVDELLREFVEKHRDYSHILIDSHAVTKEEYGFRITPFSLEQFQALRPDEIWVFYTCPDHTIIRISNNSDGRPLVTEEEARMHTSLQASVAATYGMSLGCPVYLFDTVVSRDDLVARLLARLS